MSWACPPLLGDMVRLADDTVREMMVAAVDEPDARPGMVAVISESRVEPTLYIRITGSELFFIQGLPRRAPASRSEQKERALQSC